MFHFRKKQGKASVENEWFQLMTAFFETLEIDLGDDHAKEYWLTYGLGYFSEYLKSQKAKDKLVAELELQMLRRFGGYSEEQSRALRQRIERSTSSQSPLYQELIFKGLETYTKSGTETSLLAGEKEDVKELMATFSGNGDRAF